MKYLLLLITLLLYMPILMYGAIPLATTSILQHQKIKVEHEGNIKKSKKTAFIKRAAQKILNIVPAIEGTPIFNILSLVCGIMSIAAIVGAIAALSMTFIYIGLGLGILAVGFGIVGLATSENGKGMGIAGIVVGGVFALIHYIIAAIEATL